jgi:hypothetical protein
MMDFSGFLYEAILMMQVFSTYADVKDICADASLKRVPIWVLLLC